MGVGLGFVFASAMATATLGIDPRDAGVGSAMVNTTQQVGGSVGTALLSTLFASAVSSFATDNAGSLSAGQLAAEASMHGYTTAFWWAAGILAVGGIISTFLLRARRSAVAPARRRAGHGALAGRTVRRKAYGLPHGAVA